MSTEPTNPLSEADAPDVEADVEAGAEPTPEPVELLRLSDGLPTITDSKSALMKAVEDLASGTGPIAIDAERASGYRYSSRAYLIQLRRSGTTTWLVDPIAFDSLDPLQEVLHGEEWILHAATQDLPCLTEVGLRPTALFDTELAGRLLGYPRVGLATLVEDILGYRMKKEHSAVDWSTRPLPEPWLEYAALDVEVLVDLRHRLEAELAEAGKLDWAMQEFDALRGFTPTVRVDAWRRTSGMHKVRGRRALGAIRALWEARDEIATERDVTPGRIIPDSAIVAASLANPLTKEELVATKGFHGRGSTRYASTWINALLEVQQADEEELPNRTPRGDGPPPPRAWADKDPVAAERLRRARESVAELSESHQMPVENLLTPDYLRRVLWSPPETREPGDLLDEIVGMLHGFGARGWQIALVAPVLVSAIVEADAVAAEKAQQPDQPESEADPAGQVEDTASAEGSAQGSTQGSTEGSAEPTA